MGRSAPVDEFLERGTLRVDRRKLMNKGFGLYSTHETTIFFLKMMLVSFWIGVDLIAALIVSSIPVSVLARHGILVVAAMAILISGTVFSLLFTWATGSLFGRQAVRTETGAIRNALHKLKQHPYQLVAAGAAGVSVLLIFAVVHFISLQRESELMKQLGRADLAIARKCAEVASLEKSLFQSDEQFVLTQCLLQYDKSYAMSAGGSQQRR
jgi:hypothetical protein